MQIVYFKKRERGPRWQWHRKMLNSPLRGTHWNIHPYREQVLLRTSEGNWTASAQQTDRNCREKAGEPWPLGSAWILWDSRGWWTLLFTCPSTSITSIRQLYRSSIQVLWPTCKVAAAFPDTSPRAHFGSEQRKQVGSTGGHHHTHLASPPGASPAQQASALGAISTRLAPTSLPKPPCTHNPHRARFSWGHFIHTESEGIKIYFIQIKMKRKLESQYLYQTK